MDDKPNPSWHVPARELIESSQAACADSRQQVRRLLDANDSIKAMVTRTIAVIQAGWPCRGSPPIAAALVLDELDSHEPTLLDEIKESRRCRHRARVAAQQPPLAMSVPLDQCGDVQD